MHQTAIRSTTADDLGALEGVVGATGLFPPELLGELIAGHLGEDPTDELWRTAEDHGGRAVGFAYAVPERMTEGTWNVLALAVHPDVQGRGHGAALMGDVEAELTAAGHRVLLVETSGTDAFARTRAFYRGLGYDEEARIREFYAAGDDKVVFRKALSAAR